MNSNTLAMLVAAITAIDEPVIIISARGTVIFVNAACRRLLGFIDVELPGNINQLIPVVDENSREPINLSTALLHDADFLQRINEQAVILRRNGSEFPFDMRITPLQTGQADGLMICLRDLYQTRSLADTLHFHRSHDQLTGLCNRAEFERRIQEALEQAKHSQNSHVLVYIDVDQFKLVNDSCGHLAGDELLRQMSELLRTVLGDNDVLARLGGDEFGILLWDQDIKAAEPILKKLMDHIRRFEFSWADKNFPMSVSAGVAELNGADLNWAQALGQADAACYHAKENGGNQYWLYSETDTDLAQRQTEMQWVSRIVQALQQDRFQLWAQRIQSISGDDNEGHQEILVRMIDVDGKVIPPGLFLPAAERYNLVLMLDKWVVSRTFDWMAARERAGQLVPRCNINLSGNSINQAQFHQFVAEELARSGIDPSRICFEVTETAAIENLQKARLFILQMQEIGCAFALDDFGAGMSSFAYLRTLPVNYLKIDGVFIKELPNNPIDLAMVKAINEVGKVMGMKTVAEFVENEQIVACLKTLGVDYAQGYGIAKPQPLE